MNILKDIITIISLSIGIPIALLGLIKIFREIFYKSHLINIPRTFKLCIGRNSEIEKIQKGILKRKSVFVFGVSGIGKTTTVSHAIKGISKKKIKSIYPGGVLYYDFAKNPEHTTACDQLSRQFKNKDYEDFQALLNSTECLIWLDSCEKAADLEKLISLSDNPVFIVNTRREDQFDSIFSFENNSVKLGLKGLTLADSILLISKSSKKYSKVLDGNKPAISKIIDTLGFHPYLIINASKNDLFKSEPEQYLKKLKEIGLDIIEGDKNSRVYKDGINLEGLVKLSIGFTVSETLKNMSNDAKKLLGLMGCIADEELPFILFFMKVKDEKSIKRELLGSDLIYITDQKMMKIRHSSIYEHLNANFDKYIEDNQLIIDFIDYVIMLSYAVDEKDSGIASKKFLYRNHLLKTLESIILNTDLKDESSINRISLALNLLSRFGLYENVLFFTDLLESELKIKIDDCLDEMATKLSFAKIRSYDALNMQKENIQLLQNLVFYSKNISKDGTILYLTNVNNLLIYCLKYNMFELGSSCFLETLNLVNKEEIESKKEDLAILNFMSLVYEFQYKTKSGDPDSLIKDLIELLKQFRKHIGVKDKNTVDVMLTLAFIYSKEGYSGDANRLIIEAIEIVNKVYSFKDPDSLETLDKIMDFFIEVGNSEQAYEISKIALDVAYSNFGNEHLITNRVRQRTRGFEKYFEENTFNDEKVTLHMTYEHNGKKKNKLIRLIEKIKLKIAN